MLLSLLHQCHRMTAQNRSNLTQGTAQSLQRLLRQSLKLQLCSQPESAVVAAVVGAAAAAVAQRWLAAAAASAAVASQSCHPKPGLMNLQARQLSSKNGPNRLTAEMLTECDSRQCQQETAVPGLRIGL